MIKAFTVLAATILAAAPHARSQDSAVAALQGAEARPKYGFGVGEVLDYDIRVAFARGRARLEILSLDTVRNRQALHAQFTIRGGIPGFRVNEVYDTWVDADNISTLRYHEDVHSGSYERRRRYEFYPERRLFIEGVDTVPTVERPVDQASIFYLIRTLNLRVGLDTSFNNYFLIDRNPIRIIVLGRERIRVPAGEFDAIVVRPIIKAKGVFSEGGDARVWISDDDRRIVLQVKANIPNFPLGGMNLYLRNYRPATIPPANKP
ncbi:MAG TPA: DUF3108 domain-containing protein [Gemmatimonadaceae bacterium]|nr:DUF3108 domain-containing protein [Gemmatimonadaceae bacterium]